MSAVAPVGGFQVRKSGARPPCAADFPALAASPHAHRSAGLAYLDNAATTLKPRCVLQAVEGFYAAGGGNPYRGAYQESIAATRAYEGARATVAAFAGALPGEIVFTRNATEALNLVAYSYALDRLHEGDEIALPVSEHHSNLVPWQLVCQKTGARLAYLEVDACGRLREGELERVVGPRTKLIAFAHASNVLGTLLPVEDVVRRAHACGAVTVMDCAQTAAHVSLRLDALGVDFAAFSGHKMYGPLGIGVLFARAGMLDALSPFLYGGEMGDEVERGRATFQEGPRRFEAGTPNAAGAVGLAAAVGYLASQGQDEVRAAERRLTARLLVGLASLDGVRVYGNPQADADRLGVVSFTLEGTDPQDVALVLDEAGIAIRAGTQCAQPLHRALGLQATCRASVGLYNGESDVDRFLEAVETARRRITRKVMALFP